MIEPSVLLAQYVLHITCITYVDEGLKTRLNPENTWLRNR